MPLAFALHTGALPFTGPSPLSPNFLVHYLNVALFSAV
jgi:hypothetical protein